MGRALYSFEPTKYTPGGITRPREWAITADILRKNNVIITSKLRRSVGLFFT